jgi:chromate reductase
MSAQRIDSLMPQSTPAGQIADGQLQQRFDTNIINFLDLVEASPHYPCVKRAWVEYLGEHPEPALDRVE